MENKKNYEINKSKYADKIVIPRHSKEEDSKKELISSNMNKYGYKVYIIFT